ncbi:MAG: excinuclease ABC subunit UvrC, partial [Deltaproteobacteria bacterium]|nr:excinuclease ABC subunit UvrC [Deltaproteobacteria bacterium]
SLKLTASHNFPRLWVTRKIIKDGSQYFGPYTSAFQAREVAHFIEAHFKLRTCNDHEFSNRVRPCLQYQIKRCDAPCVHLITQESYQEMVDQIRLFLQGKNHELKKEISRQMQEASEALRFEEAAEKRDLLKAIDDMAQKQQVVKFLGEDQDVIGFARLQNKVSIVVLLFRAGVLQDKKQFLFKSLEEDHELLENFLLQFYASSKIPHEICLPLSLSSPDDIEEILSERGDVKVSLLVPEKGDKKTRILMANQNAMARIQHEGLQLEQREEILHRLQQELGLKKIPRRIECYDISNIQGQMAVGSCVSFWEAEPDKANYRRFKIKTVHQANDFAMMYEILKRRLLHAEWPKPDLIVIDGGKGQLGMAEGVFQDLKVSDIDLIALAKEKNIAPIKRRHDGVSAVPKNPERIFVPGRKNPIILNERSPELHVLVRVRDEAHRFGITFHRSLRNQKNFSSELDKIEGLGPVRKRILLKKFGSLKRLKEASIDEILQMSTLSKKLAQRIYDQLRATDDDSSPHFSSNH